MSIFGSNPNKWASPEASKSTADVDLSGYARKNYVDQKDGLRILKAGDTMTGELNMNNNMIRGLPSSFRRSSHTADEAVSWGTLDATLNYRSLDYVRIYDAKFHSDLRINDHYIREVKDPERPQDAATKNYVDSRGTSITGTLEMGGNQIKGVSDPTESNDAANKNYVDGKLHKPIITVWAERKQTAKRTYDWSFGGNASGTNTNYGYKMLSPGRILRFGLEMSTRNNVAVNYGKVHITVNGTKTKYAATLVDGWLVENRLSTPLELAEGDVINFTTINTTPNVTAELATLLIELDL